jgi:hypothetical protein
MAEDAEHWKREAMAALEEMAEKEGAMTDLELANAELEEEKMEVRMRVSASPPSPHLNPPPAQLEAALEAAEQKAKTAMRQVDELQRAKVRPKNAHSPQRAAV